jgi:hypothetical protein
MLSVRRRRRSFSLREKNLHWTRSGADKGAAKQKLYVRLGNGFRSSGSSAPPNPHPALRATFSRREKEKARPMGKKLNFPP